VELVIGTKRWSTWSLRAWLVAKRSGLAFEETLITLRQENNMTGEAIAPHSPSRLVPALRTDGAVIWDSLAVSEYLAELAPHLWPKDRTLRALCRSAAAEMHSGFQALRSECAMALEAEPTTANLSEAAATDERRIVSVWRELIGRSGGPYLGGEWSIADAFFAPVATRFRTYRIDLAAHGDDGTAAAYRDRLLTLPEFLAWEKDALR
jgi:glutathione S-transferase